MNKFKKREKEWEHDDIVRHDDANRWEDGIHDAHVEIEKLDDRFRIYQRLSELNLTFGDLDACVTAQEAFTLIRDRMINNSRLIMFQTTSTDVNSGYIPNRFLPATFGYLEISRIGTNNRFEIRHHRTGLNPIQIWVASIENNIWREWSRVVMANEIATAQMQKITRDSGGPEIHITDPNVDLLEEISRRSTGLRSFYCISGTRNAPLNDRPFRGLIHLTFPTFGWVWATDNHNNLYTNYLDNGAWRGWRQLATVEETPWIDLPLLNGTENHGNRPQYRRIGNIVHLRGAFTNVLNSNTICSQLPVGFRPTGQSISYIQNTNMTTATNTLYNFARWHIGTNGNITMQGTSNQESGLQEGRWFPINTSFVVD